MVFSNTVDKNGGIQTCEFWCNLGDGGISGDADLLKIFTARINSGFDMIMPRLLSYSSDLIRWDDTNHTDSPFGYVDIVSGQPDYEVKQDANGLDILNITRVKFLKSATETKYEDLEQMTIDDPKATNAMSPNSDETGIPSTFLEKGNVIFLYKQPDYSATKGIKVFFEREQSRFVSTDATKEPGVPTPFHELPFLYASADWLLVNKPENGMLISRVEARIARIETALDNAIKKRNPVQRRITSSIVNAE